MAAPGTTPAIITCSLIIVFGIIHFGSGIGIVARYRKYQDIFRPSVGLGAFDIIVGLYAIAIGALCLFAVIQQRPALSKVFLDELEMKFDFVFQVKPERFVRLYSVFYPLHHSLVHW